MKSICGVLELRVTLACLEDTKKPVGLEQREQGGSTRRRFQEVNGISFEGSFNDRVRWGVMGGFEQINNMSQKKKSTSQDGGVGRYTLPPRTTKRRTTRNLKTKNNQNCQKIELYGSPTTKKLKKKHSSRLVGGAETGSQGREDMRQGGSWKTGRVRWRLADGQSHICVWIT